MIDKITYNYCCLEDTECKSFNKITPIVLDKDIDTDTTPIYCSCGNEMKLIGIATSLIHKGKMDGTI